MEALKSTGRPLEAPKHEDLSPLQQKIMDLVASGMTLTQIAAQWGVALPEVSRWRRGTSRPGATKLARLIDVTGLTLEQITQ